LAKGDGKTIDDATLVDAMAACMKKGKAAQSVLVDPLLGTRKDLAKEWSLIAKYLEGQQMDGDQGLGLQNKLVKNFMSGNLETLVSGLTENAPTITADSPNTMFMPKARAVAELMYWGWDISDMPVQWDLANLVAGAFRTAFLKCSWDIRQNFPHGKLVWEVVFPQNFRPCPSAKDEYTGDWYIHTEPRSLLEVREMYPGSADIQPEANWSSLATGIAPTVTGEVGSQSIESPERLGKVGGGGARDGGVVLKEMWMSERFLASVTGWDVSDGFWADGAVLVIANKTVVDFRRNPFSREKVTLTDDETGEPYESGGGHGSFPFVRIVCKPNGTFWGGMSNMELMRCDQDEYNRAISQFADYNDYRVPIIVAREGVKSPEKDGFKMFAGATFRVGETDNVNDAVKVNLAAPYGSEHFQHLGEIRQSIQTTTGISDQYAGQSGFAGESGKHAESMMRGSDARIRRIVRLEESPLERWGKLTLGMLAQNLDMDQVMQITTRSGSPAMFQYSATQTASGEAYFDPAVDQVAATMGMQPPIQLTQEELQNEWQINIESATGLPLDPEARLQKYMQLYSLGFPVEEEILNEMGVPAQDILMKMQMQKQQQAEIDMAAAQAGPMGAGPGGPGPGSKSNMGAPGMRDKKEFARDSTRAPRTGKGAGGV
jgi:hypothetical protein